MDNNQAVQSPQQSSQASSKKKSWIPFQDSKNQSEKELLKETQEEKLKQSSSLFPDKTLAERVDLLEKMVEALYRTTQRLHTDINSYEHGLFLDRVFKHKNI